MPNRPPMNVVGTASHDISEERQAVIYQEIRQQEEKYRRKGLTASTMIVRCRE